MPPKSADGARAASEAASEGGGPPTANATTSSKPTKTVKRITGKTAKTAKGKGKGKAAAPPEDTHRCFHCQSDGAKMCCSQCHRAWYCARPCQKKHWKLHKRPAGRRWRARRGGRH